MEAAVWVVAGVEEGLVPSVHGNVETVRFIGKAESEARRGKLKYAGSGASNGTVCGVAPVADAAMYASYGTADSTVATGATAMVTDPLRPGRSFTTRPCRVGATSEVRVRMASPSRRVGGGLGYGARLGGVSWFSEIVDLIVTYHE